MAKLPETMKAIIVPEYGDVDVLQLADIPFPEQKSNEVVVKINYAGVNFVDTYQRKGLYPAPKFPFQLGQEGAGTVVALPTDSKILEDEDYKANGLELGARVFVYQTGCLAEYISAPWGRVQRIPDTVSTRDACAIALQGLTALTMMTEAHNVTQGETILIHTVAGGLGLCFSQIAKARGARVIGTTSTALKAEVARTFAGADDVILYTRENTVERVLELTGGEGVHAVFDGVGKDTFDANFLILRRKGSLVSVGNASGAVPPVAPLKLTGKNIKLSRPTLANYCYTPSEMAHYSKVLFALVAAGSLKPYIYKNPGPGANEDGDYPFTVEGVKKTQVDITGHGTVGKLLVKVA